MLKVFMLVIILLTTGFGVQYAYFANFKATTITQNALAASSIVNKLKAYAIKQGNSYIMPYGVNLDSYHQLPTFISGSRVTRSGIPFVYCPFSQKAAANNDAVVKISEESSYHVSILNSGLTKGRDYVSGSPQPPVNDVVAIVISPEKKSSIPDCRDVEVGADGRYVLGGDSAKLGRVHVLTVHDVQTSDRVNVEYVDSSDANALSSAFQEVANRPAEDHIIILSSGEDYTIANSYNFTPVFLGKKGSVTIRGEDAASPSGITSLTNQSLSFDDMLVTIENISFSNTIKVIADDSVLDVRGVNGGIVNVYRSDVSFDNVGFNGNTIGESALQIINSEVDVKNALNVTSSTNPALYIQDSAVVHDNGDLLLGTSDGAVGLQMLNSQWASRMTDLNFSVNSGTAQAVVYIDSESSFVVSDGVMVGTGDLTWGVFSLGVLQTQNYGFKLNQNSLTGVYLGKGSRSSFGSSSVGFSGFPVATGVNDGGSLSVVGELNIYATNCFVGDGFSRDLTDTIPDSVVTQVNPDFSIVVGSVSKSVNLDITSNFNSLQANCL